MRLLKRLNQRILRLFRILGLLAFLTGCGGGAREKKEAQQVQEPAQPAAAGVQSPDSSFEERLARERWTGDLDGMVQRRYLRALVIYSKTFYFLDGANERGITYEALKEFEKLLNEKLKTGKLTVHVIFIPVRRDELIPALADGRGDIAAANLTITPERQKLADFSAPALTDVREIVVAAPNSPPLAGLDDLAGKEVYVRASSSYYESLRRQNDSFRKAGKAEIKVIAADENLEDEDILEMVNAGLIGLTVIDSHKAGFWQKIFTDIHLYSDLAVSTQGEIGWAFRKNSPKLREVVDAFLISHREGTAFGNTILRRYLQTTKWVKNSTTQEEMKKFQATVGFFKKYGSQYGFDALMLAAQGYQESRLDQKVRSRVGAVGVMQVMPKTAAGPPVNIRNIENMENNIQAGVKLMHFIINDYFKDDPMDQMNKTLMAFASYNAGPARIARLRKKAAEQGLDPNKWFGNVELVVAKDIGRETTQYVSNIYKYYLAYKMINERAALREAAVKSARSSPKK